MAKSVRVKGHYRNGKKVAGHKRMKPKGARGRAQVKRLGRNYKTGGFKRIAAEADKRYGKGHGARIAGAIFQRMAAKHARGG